MIRSDQYRLPSLASYHVQQSLYPGFGGRDAVGQAIAVKISGKVGDDATGVDFYDAAAVIPVSEAAGGFSSGEVKLACPESFDKLRTGTVEGEASVTLDSMAGLR